jgi:hypothetical protein
MPLGVLTTAATCRALGAPFRFFFIFLYAFWLLDDFFLSFFGFLVFSQFFLAFGKNKKTQKTRFFPSA